MTTMMMMLREQPALVVPRTGFNVVLTHCTADFDSLASAVALAKLWSAEDQQQQQHEEEEEDCFDGDDEDCVCNDCFGVDDGGEGGRCPFDCSLVVVVVVVVGGVVFTVVVVVVSSVETGTGNSVLLLLVLVERSVRSVWLLLPVAAAAAAAAAAVSVCFEVASLRRMTFP